MRHFASTWGEGKAPASGPVEARASGGLAIVAVGVPILLVGLAAVSSCEFACELRALFAALCHQVPDRCMTLADGPMGLCARCMGLYLGLGMGHGWFLWRETGEAAAWRGLILGGAVLFAEWALGWMVGWESGLWVRAATGWVAGFWCAWFTLQGLRELWGLSTRGDRTYER
jgi:uncharacterized membrane protein